MAREQFTFCHRLRVRWAEVDKQSIVYNVNYFLYFDVAITEYWRSIGILYPEGYARFASKFAPTPTRQTRFDICVSSY